MKLKPFQSKHAEHQAALEQLCAEWGYWTYGEVIKALESPFYELRFLEAATPNPLTWIGVLFFTHIQDTVEVFYVYICPPYRGVGYGKLLMQALDRYLQDQDLTVTMFLEVRASHTSAIRLYQQHHMTCLQTRKHYYRDGEDALVFQKHISP